MNWTGKIGGALALVLLAGVFAAAQEEMTWNMDVSTNDDYMGPEVCQSAPNDAPAQLAKGRFSVDSFQYEYAGEIRGGEGNYTYRATSNIGRPLYIILSDSFAYYDTTDGDTILCPSERRKRIAQIFLDKGADPNGGLWHEKGNNTNKSRDGEHKYFLIDTPLGYAARTGNLDIAKMLLRAGADPNYSWQGYWERRDNGHVSWDQDQSHFALEQVVGRAVYPVNRRVQMIELLTRNGADVNAVTYCGMTSLALLVARTGGVFSDYKRLPFAEAKEMAQALLNAGAKTNTKGENFCRNHRGAMTVKEVMKELPAWEKEQWDAFFKSARRR